MKNTKQIILETQPSTLDVQSQFLERGKKIESDQSLEYGNKNS